MMGLRTRRREEDVGPGQGAGAMGEWNALQAREHRRVIIIRSPPIPVVPLFLLLAIILGHSPNPSFPLPQPLQHPAESHAHAGSH